MAILTEFTFAGVWAFLVECFKKEPPLTQDGNHNMQVQGTNNTVTLNSNMVTLALNSQSPVKKSGKIQVQYATPLKQSATITANQTVKLTRVGYLLGGAQIDEDIVTKEGTCFDIPLTISKLARIRNGQLQVAAQLRFVLDGISVDIPVSVSEQCEPIFENGQRLGGLNITSKALGCQDFVLNTDTFHDKEAVYQALLHFVPPSKSEPRPMIGCGVIPARIDELAVMTGFSNATIYAILRELINDGRADEGPGVPPFYWAIPKY